MEHYERPESSTRPEISEHRHDEAEMSSKSLMGNRERAEAGSVQVARRVVINRERLGEATVRADLEDGHHSAQTDIKTVMEAAEEIRKGNVFVAHMLDKYAHDLASRMDPLSEGGGLFNFKSGLKAAIMEKKEAKSFVRVQSGHLRVMNDYISEFKEKEDIANLDAEEQAAREGRAPEGERPEYQAWRTETLRRFYEILHVLYAAAVFFFDTIDYGVEHADQPFEFLSEKDQLVYSHWRLFIAYAEVVSHKRHLSYWEIKSTAAKFSKLHDETFARDMKQFLNANTLINKLWGSSIFSRILGWITSSNEPIRGDRPTAGNLVYFCEKEIRKAEYTWKKVKKVEKVGGAVVGHVMNRDQCHFLMGALQETRYCLRQIYSSNLTVNPILVLGELLQTLHDAHILIEASLITTKFQWPRAAVEQGDMNHTFSRLLYELRWHLCVLFRMMKLGTYRFVGSHFLKSEVVETALVSASKKDIKGLKHRLRSVKVADRTEQDLVDQLLSRMEAPSSDLVFLNPADFDRKGAVYIGKGSFGAVLETNFLGRQCAVKVIKGARGSQVDREFEKETNAAKKLGNHPNLVRLYCYSKTNDACYLIMERMQMNLAEVLRLKNENGDGLSMVEAVALMLQIGEGLKHIHSKGAAHRDLKPANILVNLADPSRKKLSRIRSVKISDFGLTKTQAALIACSNHTRNTGTSVYMAPEVMKLGGDDPERTRYNPAKADVYSFAVVCSEILTGETPYGELKAKQMKEQVKAGTLRPNLPTDCPVRLTTLIKKCWAGNYDERPLLPEVCRELRYIKGLLLMYVDFGRH